MLSSTTLVTYLVFSSVLERLMTCRWSLSFRDLLTDMKMSCDCHDFLASQICSIASIVGLDTVESIVPGDLAARWPTSGLCNYSRSS